MKTIQPRNRGQWRSWLQKNHISKESVWLVYNKKHTGKPSVRYVDAVEEAICFGWIDGQIKKIDEDKYMQRFSLRTPKSIWSEINVERAKKMIKQGDMSEYGLKIFREGTKTKTRIPSSKHFSVPTYFREALAKNKKAWTNFQQFSPSAKLAYVYWVGSAKTDGTRERRIKETVERLAKNKKFGEV